MKPTYNHTREDSPLTPCPLCVPLRKLTLKQARARIEELERSLKNTENTLHNWIARATRAEDQLAEAQRAHDALAAAVAKKGKRKK